MELNSLHLLLTYQCTLECAHCFAWGSPWQRGTMSLSDVGIILRQAQDLGGIQSIYFEGGEAFLYYATLLNAVRRASELDFETGIVTNAYWATSLEDAYHWLRPFAFLVQDLSISSDGYHWPAEVGQRVTNAVTAARQLGIPVGTITIAEPTVQDAGGALGHLPAGESQVMFRGRAAVELAPLAEQHAAETFTACEHENLRDPGRVHIDPLGYVHMCQGITIGNIYDRPLREIVGDYRPEEHPIVGPLLAGGPAGLAQRYGLDGRIGYADGCHLCYETRQVLRTRFPEQLAPDQMYGVLA